MSPVRRARAAVTAIFVLNGVIYGAWAARIPAIRDRLDLSDGELGIALAFVPLGAILAMPAAGALAARAGSRVSTQLGFGVACAAAGVIALAPSLAVLCALALVLGLGMGALDVSMNMHGVTVERRMQRPIFAGLHAGFSFGGLAGAALGALAAAADLDVRVHLAIVAAACAAIGLTWSRGFLPAAEDAGGKAAPMFARPSRQLSGLGALAFACLLIEGAAADWSGVYIRDELGGSAAVAALGFTAFSVTMTIGRLLGDGLLLRIGPVRVVRAGGLIAATGFGLALVVATPAAALVGCACLGAGMAGVIPIVFRSAGQVSAVALAAVSSIGYFGFVAGPPLIGAVAEVVTLPRALVLIALLGAVVAALAPASIVRGEEPEPREAEASPA